MLRLNKIYLLIAWGITCFLFYGVATHADEWNQSTKMTFSQPIRVPGVTLPAGTYLFKLAETDDRHIVQIFDANGTVLFATAMAIAAERPAPTGDTEVTFAGQGQSEPEALLKWFYPGELTGHEFVYPERQEQQFAEEQHVNILARAGAITSGD